MPKSVTYVGDHFAVDVPALRGCVAVERNQTVNDVPDDIAKSLIESGQWKEAEAEKPAKAEQKEGK